MTGIIVAEIVPFSTQTCTFVIDRLSTVPLMVNGSPRNTFRDDLDIGSDAGAFAVITGTPIAGTGEDAFIGGTVVVTFPAGVAFVGGGAGYDNDGGLKTPAGIM